MWGLCTAVNYSAAVRRGAGSSSHGGNGMVLVGVLEGMLVVMMEVTEVMVMENRSGGGDGGNGNSGAVVVV